MWDTNLDKIIDLYSKNFIKCKLFYEVYKFRQNNPFIQQKFHKMFLLNHYKLSLLNLLLLFIEEEQKKNNVK